MALNGRIYFVLYLQILCFYLVRQNYSGYILKLRIVTKIKYQHYFKLQQLMKHHNNICLWFEFRCLVILWRSFKQSNIFRFCKLAQFFADTYLLKEIFELCTLYWLIRWHSIIMKTFCGYLHKLKHLQIFMCYSYYYDKQNKNSIYTFLNLGQDLKALSLFYTRSDSAITHIVFLFYFSENIIYIIKSYCPHSTLMYFNLHYMTRLSLKVARNFFWRVYITKI